MENGQNLVQCPGESEEDFNKRLRKVNYLSLAQEFAELQRKNSDAGLDGANTVGSNPTSAEGTESKTKSEPQVTAENPTDKDTEDFEVYTLETSLKPTFNWEDLEQKIQQATRSQSTLVGGDGHFQTEHYQLILYQNKSCFKLLYTLNFKADEKLFWDAFWVLQVVQTAFIKKYFFFVNRST